MSHDESQMSNQIGYNEFDQLVKKVLYVCRERGQLVTGALASFVVETLYNPGKHLYNFSNNNRNNAILQRRWYKKATLR